MYHILYPFFSYYASFIFPFLKVLYWRYGQNLRFRPFDRSLIKIWIIYSFPNFISCSLWTGFSSLCSNSTTLTDLCGRNRYNFAWFIWHFRWFFLWYPPCVWRFSHFFITNVLLTFRTISAAFSKDSQKIKLLFLFHVERYPTSSKDESSKRIYL